MTHLSDTHLSDTHLDDPRWNRDLRSEEAANDARLIALLKRKLDILTDHSEMVQLITEYPDTVAKLILPLLGEDYEDSVPKFRQGIKLIAEQIADADTMSIDAFKREA